MDCDLCRLHRSAGWTFSQLIEVYAGRRDIYKKLNMPKGELYPPLPSRSYVRPQSMKDPNLLNLKAYSTPFHLLPKDLQQKILLFKNDLVQFHSKMNKEQAKAFVDQEMKIMSEFIMASTEESKEYIFSGLDTWTQYLLNV